MRSVLLNSLPLAAAALFFAADLHAQTRPPQPGRVERDIRPAPEPFRRDGLRIDAPRFAEDAPPGAHEQRFILGEVQLSGNDALPTTALVPAWAPLLGRQITLAQAFGIASAVSARYRAAGYILSQAIVPAQEIRTTGEAVLRIEVIEGFIDKITFTGNVPAAALQPYLRPVGRERPLRLPTLERSLLLVSELPGVTAQAHLRASDTPRASDLEIVTAQKRTEYSLSAHNRSTPSQGRVRYEASAAVHGVLAAFDRHQLRWVTSGGSKLNLLAYGAEVPLGANGLKLQLGASASRSEPDTQLAFSNIDTRSDNVSLGLAYPLLRSRERNLALRAAFNGYDNSADVAGTRISQDRIRALRVGLTADRSDAWGGISLLDIEWSRGLSALGASKAGDAGVDADPQFGRFSAYAARLQNLGGSWSALLAATAQTSGDKLPTAEQLGLGGETFLRAFDPSEVIGEKGAAGKLELRRDAAWPRFGATFYAYGDVGSVRRWQPAGQYASTSLTSAGVGVRVSGPGRTRGYLEIAKPGRRDVASEGNRDARVFAGAGIDF